MEAAESLAMRRVRTEIPERLATLREERAQAKRHIAEITAHKQATDGKFSATDEVLLTTKVRELDTEEEALRAELQQSTAAVHDMLREGDELSELEQARQQEKWMPEAINYLREMLSCAARGVVA